MEKDLSFGELIAAARRAKGLEQADLGRLLRTSQQNVSRWEQSRSRPRLSQFPALAAALGVKENELREAAGYGAPAEILPTRVTLSHDQPFPVDALSPESFQRFTEDLVRALHADAREVRAAGKTGHDQGGTDILAVLADGRRLSFQCKRVTRFGPADVRKAVTTHTVPANHKYLVLSRVARPETAEALRAFADWTLWDKDDIGRLLRDQVPAVARRALVDKYFPGQRYALLGEPPAGPWQTPEEFFAPFGGTHATFSHDWDLVGRRDDVAAILTGLKSDQPRIVLLLGAGGSGKSRVLKSVVKALGAEGITPLFLSPTESLNAQALEMLGQGPAVVIVDDAHDRIDLPALFAFAANPRRNIRILLATRPYARARLRGQAGEYARGGAISEVTLEPLNLKETTKLAAEVLAKFGGAEQFAEPIARATLDCPLVTVLAARIAVEQNLPLGLAQTAEAFRDTILGKFAEIITGELAPPGERNIFTDILKLISLVQPFSIEDAAFLDLAETIAGIARDKTSATLRTLIEGGILFKRGNQYRLMPDLLGDYIIERTCIGANERLDGFADQVFAQAVQPLLGHVLVNLGRLDWRRASGNPAKSNLVTHLWRALEVIDQHHDSALEAATNAAFYQPRQALDFVVRQWRAGVRRDELVKILRNVAYHQDHLIEACELLWEIGRADERDQSRFENYAMRTLKELCAVEPDKPLAFNEAIVEFGLKLLQRDDAFNTLFSPFDFLKGILAGEGYTTTGDNRSITFKPFEVNTDAVKPLRGQVIDRALALLTGPSLRAAGRAAAFLEEALRFPMVSFGGRLSNDSRAYYTTEFCATLKRLAKLVQSDTLDPAISVAIAHAVAWHKNYAGGETAAAARKLFENLPNDLEFRLLAALSDGFGNVFVGRMDTNSWQTRLNQWVGEIIADLSAAHPKAPALRKALEGALVRTAEAGLAQNNSSHVLVHEVLRKRVDLARLVVADAGTGRGLDAYLDAALVQVLHAKPEEARRAAHRFLDSGKVPLQRAVGRAFSQPPLNEGVLAPDDADIIKRVLSSPDARVVMDGVGVLGVLARNNWRTALDLLRYVQLNGNEHVADRAFMMLHGLQDDVFAALNEDDVRFVLDALKPLPELKGHWIETLLAHLSQHFPELTAGFFIDRVNLATATDEAFSKYRPINYGPWVHVRLRFKESARYSVVLESIWTWMTEHDPDNWRFEHHASVLFEGMFLPIDDAVLSFLSTKMITADPKALRWIASVLAHADRRFVFDQQQMAIRFLDLCERAGEETRKKAVHALYRSGISGVTTSRPGEPAPRDIETKAESEALLARLPRLSAAYELYDTLRRHAEQSMAWARNDAEGFDDV